MPGMTPYMYVPYIPPPPREQSPPPVHPGGDKIPLGNAGFFCAGLEKSAAAREIMIAVVKGDAQKLKNLLSHPQALPDFSNACGITPLMAAAAHGHTDITDMLAAHPLTDLNRLCHDGMTALHYAACWGRANCVRTLLAHHADFMCGKTPAHLAARDDAVKGAFRDDKKFKQYAVRHMPLADKGAPKESVVHSKSGGEDDIIKAVVKEGIDGHFGHDYLDKELTTKNIIDRLPEMTEVDFAQVMKHLRRYNGTYHAMPWAQIFIEAAKVGNVPVMLLIDKSWTMPQQNTLDGALEEVLEKGDDRHTAHILLALGANANVMRTKLPPVMGDAPVKYRLHQRALALERGGILEEMVLWTEDFSGFDKKYRAVERASATETALGFYDEKIRLTGLGAKKLCRAFEDAARNDDMERMMAAYAESRHYRFFRREEPFKAIDKFTLREAFVLALKNERYDFASRMLRDGYSPAGIRFNPFDDNFLTSASTPAAAREFFRDALSGKMKPAPILSVSDRRKALNAQVVPINGMWLA